MYAPMLVEIADRMNAIRAIQVPECLSHRAEMWKMAHSGEIVDSQMVIRAIARYDILESPVVVKHLYELHGDLVPSTLDDEEKVTRLMALLSMKAIASFMGY